MRNRGGKAVWGVIVAWGVLLGWVVAVGGCSSTFSFSWKAEKKVETKGRTLEKRAALPTVLSPSRVMTPQGKEGIAENQAPRFRATGTWLYGVQVTRLPQRSPRGLAQFMDTLRDAGVQVVYFRVFQNAGDEFLYVLPCRAKEGVYFRSSYAPLVSNLLPLVCRLAHQRGIKVYAWMTTLSSDFLDCKKKRYISKYVPETKSVVRTRRLSPFDPEVARCLSGLFEDLARNPIDGILIQDDLILHYNEDFSPLAVRRFTQEMGEKGVSPDDLYRFRVSGRKRFLLEEYSPLFWKWSDWKNRQLSKFLKRLIAVIKRVRSSIDVAVDVNYEALSAPENGLAWFSRSIHVMEKIAHPDTYVVMSYQRQMQRELRLSEHDVFGRIQDMVKSALALVPDPDRWVFKVQTIDWRTREPVGWRQIEQTVRAIHATAPVRTCLMPFTPPLFEGDKFARFNLSRN